MSEKIDESMAERVGRALTAEPGIEFATLFGSEAAGRATPQSDLDVAVWAQAPIDSSTKQRLIETLAEVSGRPVDLVDLRTAGLPIARSALLHGRRIMCRDNTAYAALVARTLADTADFLPYRERLLRRRRMRWTH